VCVCVCASVQRVKNSTNGDHNAHSSLMADLRLSEPNDCIFFFLRLVGLSFDYYYYL